eukprot:6208098-Pleurochrysis_carterae.AAC.2
MEDCVMDDTSLDACVLRDRVVTREGAGRFLCECRLGRRFDERLRLVRAERRVCAVLRLHRVGRLRLHRVGRLRLHRAGLCLQRRGRAGRVLVASLHCPQRLVVAAAAARLSVALVHHPIRVLV